MTPDAAKAMYRRMIGVGEIIYIRRYTGQGSNRPYYDVPVRGRAIEYQPAELVGNIQQGDRRIVFLAEDLISGQYPVPLRKGDKAVVRGKELNIEAPDEGTRSVASVIVAYDLRVRGP